MIAKPGPYPLAGPTSVLQLIATAGGVAEYADKKKIVIVRKENGKEITLRFNYDDVMKGKNLAQNIELETRRLDHRSVDVQRCPPSARFWPRASCCQRVCRRLPSIAANAPIAASLRAASTPPVNRSPHKARSAAATTTTCWQGRAPRTPSATHRKDRSPSSPAASTMRLASAQAASTPPRARPSATTRRSPGSTTGNYNASIGGTFLVSARPAITVHQSASYRPYTFLEIFPNVDEPPIGASDVPEPDLVPLARQYVAYAGGADLRQQVTRRGTFSIVLELWDHRPTVESLLAAVGRRELLRQT